MLSGIFHGLFVYNVVLHKNQHGDVEFPQGTKIRGVVTEAQPAGDGEPGVLALDFRQVILPDGHNQVSAVDMDLNCKTSGIPKEWYSWMFL